MGLILKLHLEENKMEENERYWNHGKSWDRGQSNLLLNMFYSGHSLANISKHMGRSPTAIVCQLVKLKKLANIAGNYHKISPNPFATFKDIKEHEMTENNLAQQMKAVADSHIDSINSRFEEIVTRIKALAEDGRYEFKTEVAHLSSNVVQALMDKFALAGFYVKTINNSMILVVSWRDI